MTFAAKPHRRPFQYSLRTLLLVMLLASLPLSWLGATLRSAGRQREAVEAILASGGSVKYADEKFPPERSAPAWLDNLLGTGFFVNLENLLGKDFFVNVAEARVESDAGMELLPRLTQLRTLFADNVTDAGLEHLKGLTELKHVCIYHSRVTDAGLEHLKGLTQLRSLILCFVQVTDAGLEHLKGLTRLKRLTLNQTQVTDAGLEHLKGLTELEQLYFGGNIGVTHAGLERVKALPKLTMLVDTYGTNVLEAARVTKSPEAVPNCRNSR